MLKILTTTAYYGKNLLNQKSRVIVIGTSAGGLEALFRIVPGLARDLAAPVLVVLHIGAHRSQLPELLSARGPLPAVFAQTAMIPEAGHIYVAPPDHHMLLENGVLRLFHGPKEHFARPAIDPLFRSAALDRRNAAIGVILTGMLDDGSAGLQAIEACGGTTVVQDPAEALEPSMPLSALRSVQVDHLVRLDAMANLLNQLAQPVEHGASAAPEWLRVEHQISLGHAGLDDLSRVGVPSRFTCPDCGGALSELTNGTFVRFLCHTGHAYSLRSLAAAHETLTEDVLWAGLRALQEKEAILRRLAESQASDLPGSEKETLAEANRLAALIVQMRAMLEVRESSVFAT